MNKNTLITRILFIGLFIICLSLSANSYSQAAAKTARAMWVWNWRIVSDEEKSAELLAFCRDRGITTLFLNAGVNLDDENISVDYAGFISQAHEQGIRVDALAGDPRWSYVRYHKEALRWVKSVIDYNQRVSKLERFNGIHYDVEPYALGSVWENNKINLLEEYTELIRKTQSFIDKCGGNVQLGLDLPFWYDEPELVIGKGLTKPAFFMMLDSADYAVVMAYRDTAEGPNGTIKLSEDELIYARAVKKYILIGQETQKGFEPDFISFGSHDLEYMEKEFSKITEAFSDNKYFAGIAIHYYQSYKAMK